MAETILGLLGALASIVLVVLKARGDVAAKNAAKRAEADAALRASLADGRITDAGAAQARRRTLPPLCFICSLLLGLSGCATAQGPAAGPLVVGERIYKPKPGEVLTVPALLPPARQWYLVDDVGLGEWLGLTPEE